MRWIARLTAVVLLTFAAGAPAAAPVWFEARTAHFRIYGALPEESLKKFATRLEQFDKALRINRHVPDDPMFQANPLTVYTVSDASAVAELCGKGCKDVAGFYSPRVTGSIAFTPQHAGTGKFDLRAEPVLFHEYTHHFMLQNFSAAYPAWFVEGFAEFFATANFLPNGGIQFGAVPLYRAYGLVEDTMPIERLLSASVWELDGRERDLLYGRGWLLTHYLTFEPSRAGQFQTYLDKLNAGASSLDAAKQAFGDLKTLKFELDRYINRRRLGGFVVAASALDVGEVRLRRLSAGEAAMMPIRIRSTRGVDKAEAAALVVQARRVAQPYQDAIVQRELAEAEFDAGYDDAAEAAADRALAADPTLREAMIYKGLVRVRRAARAGVHDPAVWKEARSWFLKANRLDVNDAEPLYFFYASFGAAGERPTRNAVDALLGAYNRAPQDPSLRLTVVRQLLLDGKSVDARAILAPLAFDPHAGKDNVARQIMGQIDSGMTGPAIVAKMDAGPEAVKAVDPPEKKGVD